jgi:peptidoglycan/LPS O-acetylase OafA/YrhL
VEFRLAVQLSVANLKYFKEKNRNLGVDLARTFAILGVVLVHTTGLWFGRFGVQLFFMISGFLLANFEIRQTKKIFLIHRFFRLFPLSIAFLFIFYFSDFDKMDLVFNLTLFSNLWWSIPKYPGGWSISSEWIFSLILVGVGGFSRSKAYFLILSSALSSLALGAYVFLLGGAEISAGVEQYEFRTWLNTTNPLVNFGFFAIGIAIKKDYINLNKVNKYVLLIICILMAVEDKIIGHFLFGWMLALAALFTMCLKFNSDKYKSDLIIHFIGKRTYGIFFTHFLLLDSSYTMQFYNWLQLPAGTFFYKIFNFVVVFSLSLIGGSLTYIFIEKPFLILSKNIEIALKK